MANQSLVVLAAAQAWLLSLSVTSQQAACCRKCSGWSGLLGLGCCCMVYCLGGEPGLRGTGGSSCQGACMIFPRHRREGLGRVSAVEKQAYGEGRGYVGKRSC